MLKIFPMIFVFMYVLISMAYTIEFVVTHSGGGWGLAQVIEHSFLWPTRLI